MSQRNPNGEVHTETHFVMVPASTSQNGCSSCETLIWERVRALRHERNLSIRALAERCGISINTLSLIENNRTSPSVHTLNLLAGGLGVPVIALFEEKEHKQELVYQRDGERDAIRFAHGTLERLGEGLPPLGAEPILVTLEADQEEMASHNGREFIYCLEGKMTCLFPGQNYVSEFVYISQNVNVYCKGRYVGNAWVNGSIHVSGMKTGDFLYLNGSGYLTGSGFFDCPE